MKSPIEFLQERERSILEDDYDDIRTNEIVEESKYPLSDAPSLRIRGGNTGPKSVLADYAENKEWLKLRNEVENLRNEWKLQKSIAPIQSTREEAEDQQCEEDYIEDDQDEKFFEEYKRKRIEELYSMKSRTFGFLRKVDKTSLVDEIDKEDSQVYIVIHIYEEYIPQCTKLNKYLQDLAIEYSRVKFLKAIASETLASIDPIALPTLSVYKAGERYITFMRLQDMLGTNFTLDDVEKLLCSHKILEKTAINQFSSYKMAYDA